MNLDKKLLDGFSQLLNEKGNEKKKPTVLYGTTALNEDGELCVQLDGAEEDMLIPCPSTVACDEGQRVTVSIENHKAIITGCLSDKAVTESGIEDIEDMAEEAKSAADVAKEAAEKAQEDLEIIQSQEGTLELLSNNVQGMYLGSDGKLYMSAELIKADSMSADRVRTGRLVSDNFRYSDEEYYLKVTGSNVSTYFSTTGGTNPFTWDSTLGKWKSTNHTDSSTGWSSWTVKNDCTIKVEYSVSSESNYDKFSIVNGSNTWVNGISGSSDGSFEDVPLAAGEVIRFQYVKDSSRSNGDDCGCFNLYVLTTGGGSVFSESGTAIDLDNGTILSPYFSVLGDNAYFSGSVSADDFTFNKTINGLAYKIGVNDNKLYMSCGEEQTGLNTAYVEISPSGRGTDIAIHGTNVSITGTGVNINGQTPCPLIHSHTETEIDISSTGTKQLDFTAKTLSTDTSGLLGSTIIPAGKWIVVISANFASNSKGRRNITLSTTSGTTAANSNTSMTVQAANGGATVISRTVLLDLSSSTSYYLNAIQFSGSSLSVTGSLYAFRIAL